MPELPEVETVVRGLAPLLVGRKVRKLEVLDPKLDLHPSRLPRNRMIRRVHRHGKEIIIDLSQRGKPQKPLWLCVHLRMTGKLIWTPPPSAPPERHLRARIALDRGDLLFVDARRFGTMRLMSDLAGAFPPGLDPLAPEFTPAALADLLEQSIQAIKPWLLRQDRLIGLGNIYASEILFAAKIPPTRPAGSLTPDEIRRLHRHTRHLLERAIKYCGTTFSDFRDERGRSGRFRRFLKVYGREDDPCRRCGRPVQRLVQQGRSTFCCPACQK
jgi:formamidopyrimidine-DNA glycosylase